MTTGRINQVADLPSNRPGSWYSCSIRGVRGLDWRTNPTASYTRYTTQSWPSSWEASFPRMIPMFWRRPWQPSRLPESKEVGPAHWRPTSRTSSHHTGTITEHILTFPGISAPQVSQAPQSFRTNEQVETLSIPSHSWTDQGTTATPCICFETTALQ